jgi:hypothetical protein
MRTFILAWVIMVCGGVAMLGMAQGLRLLLVLIVLAHH